MSVFKIIKVSDFILQWISSCFFFVRYELTSSFNNEGKDYQLFSNIASEANHQEKFKTTAITTVAAKQTKIEL